MPEKKIMWPHTTRPDYNKAEYVKAEIEKMREFAFKEIDEAMSINNRVYKNICLFSLIDCFAQEYANYPTSGLSKAFCDFILKFQDYYDYLELPEPVTLFYDYEPKLRELASGPEMPEPELSEPGTEVSIDDLGPLDGQKVSEIIRTNKAEEILTVIRREEGRKEAKNYRRNHSLIHLIYKMRSKAVHELSRMGNENKWEIEDGRDEPFYRDMVRLYEFEGNIVSEDFYELVIPNRFIYNLTQNTLSNFFDFCLKEQRLPLENRSNFKRAVDLTWRD